MSEIMYNQVALTGDEYDKKQWKLIAVHDDTHACGFFGPYLFLSNFYPATVEVEGRTYPTVENAYQAMKYRANSRSYFESCSPYEAKVYTHNHKDTMLYQGEEWNLYKVSIMRDLLYKKFSDEHKELQDRLLATKGKELEETNWWEDFFWGRYTKSKDIPAVGENMLGKLLMEVRDYYLQQG